MSDNAEQITKEPSIAPKREKDPKRVAAGKKLAEKNKQMREEHARLKASEEERRVSEAQRATDSLHETTTDQLSSDVVGGLLSQLSLTNVISLVGIGLTIYTIFFKKSGEKQETRQAWQEPVHTTLQQPKPKTEEAQKNDELKRQDQGSRRESKPRPKFGM